MNDATQPSASEISQAGESRELSVIWLAPWDELRVTCLDDRKLTLGRDDDCSVRLMAAGVSRRHAELRPSPPLWLLADLDSTNGVYLNGKPVREAPLAQHDVLRLGDAIAVVAGGPLGRLSPHFSRLEDELYGGARFAARLADVRRVAASSLSTVIEGETGSGKEQLARAVHRWSGRSGPFIAVNCAALPVALAETELFGHARGAFTGAERAHTGYLRSAHQGTLFLDEVLELPLPLQAKLLRAVEAKEVVPIGETRPVATDARLVVATQKPLKDCVAAGTFRADLMARLSEFTVVLPPLRERKEDIPGLFRHFLRAACGGSAPALSAKLVEALCLHAWPLNVRELRNAARQTAVLHSHESVLLVRHLPSNLFGARESRSNVPGASLEKGGQRDARDLELLVEALKLCDGHLGKACERAGVSRQRAQRLLSRFPGRDPRR